MGLFSRTICAYFLSVSNEAAGQEHKDNVSGKISDERFGKKKLTPRILNELIDKIEVYQSEIIDDKRFTHDKA